MSGSVWQSLYLSLIHIYSYISKWISGKLLPTEKNHEATLQAISNCVVDSLTEDGTTQLLQEYQLQDIDVYKRQSGD